MSGTEDSTFRPPFDATSSSREWPHPAQTGGFRSQDMGGSEFGHPQGHSSADFVTTGASSSALDRLPQQLSSENSDQIQRGLFLVQGEPSNLSGPLARPPEISSLNRREKQAREEIKSYLSCRSARYLADQQMALVFSLFLASVVDGKKRLSKSFIRMANRTAKKTQTIPDHTKQLRT